MKTAAVFATMNRADTASECLRRLGGQILRPLLVVVTDNASSDGTAERLETTGKELGLPFELIRSPDNLGNAGGIRLAMDRAFAAGAEFVWILDDDSWPEPGALEKLLDERGPEGGIRSSVVLAPEGDTGSWPLEVPGEGRRWKIDWTPLEGAEADWVRVRRSWLGALIPRAAYEEVGPVNGELFLRGEDEDYPRRLVRAGYDFWLCKRSVLRHPQAGKLMVLELFGKRMCLEQGLEGDKLYYRLRNMLWIKRRERGRLALAVLAVGYALLLVRGRRSGGDGLGILVESSRDALSGKLGRRQR